MSARTKRYGNRKYALPLDEITEATEAPRTRSKPARAHRGTRVRIYKSGREKVPHLIPTDRDRKEFDLVRPEEVAQGYQVRHREELAEPAAGDP